VANQVYSGFQKQQEDKLKMFLKVSAHESQLGSIRGLLFEQTALKALETGGKFRTQRLADKKTELLSLRKTSICHSFTKLTDLAPIPVNTLAIPCAKNWESVDAIFKPNYLFQITVLKHHPCKQAGLHHILNHMDLTEDKFKPASPQKKMRGANQAVAVAQGQKVPRLYFVVPEDIYEDFDPQPYHDNKSLVIDPTYTNVQNIEQWCLCVPLAK